MLQMSQKAGQSDVWDVQYVLGSGKRWNKHIGGAGGFDEARRAANILSFKILTNDE